MGRVLESFECTDRACQRHTPEAERVLVSALLERPGASSESGPPTGHDLSTQLECTYRASWHGDQGLDPTARAIRKTKLDNVALVPASLLPFKHEWQAIANELPKGGILVVLPSSRKPHRIALETAENLKDRGQAVTILSTQHFR